MLDKCGDTATLKILRNGKAQTVTIKKGAYKYFAPTAKSDFYQVMYIKDNAYHAVDLNDGYRITKIDGKKKTLTETLRNLKAARRLRLKRTARSTKALSPS